MHTFSRVVLAAVAAACLPSLAEAKVHITVDLDNQTIHIQSKNQVFDWKVSSGKNGYETPAGTYGVLWMDKDHFSDEYNKAPMPNAIFFKPGFAIHGAYKSDFGHPASHGCVRLPVAKSAILFDLVKAEGAEVKIVGGDGPATVEAGNRQRPDATPAYDDEPYGYDSEPASRRGPVTSAPQRRASGLNALFGSVY